MPRMTDGAPVRCGFVWLIRYSSLKNVPVKKCARQEYRIVYTDRREHGFNLRPLRNLRSDFRRYRCLPVVLLVLRKTPIAATAGAKTNAIRAGPDTFSS
jgi:hypothetical protein